MPIDITGKFQPSGGPGAFKLLDGFDIDWYQGTGAPSATATEGSLYWDTTNNILWVNSNGGTAWMRVTGYSLVQYTNIPDAAVGAVVTAGDGQGIIHHSYRSITLGGEIALRLFIDAKVAPGASGLPVTWQYGDTDDLDTVASWTEIGTKTLSSEKSTTQVIASVAIPEGRLIRTNWGTIVGSPSDASTILEVLRFTYTA